ncbi:MAG TPA: DMT family transporter [Desulfobulbaceae bacterium]|nr:DMT family transporter [Desulfobulbaceae bacterium]
MAADLLLLLTALIWGFGFVAQRAGMEYIGPYTFNGIRFLLGGFCLLPLALRSDRSVSPEIPATIAPLKAGFYAGLVLFCGASLQQVGLLYTSAGKAGFITGLYVIFVPIFGLFFGKQTGAGTWGGAFLATAGMYFLSVKADFSIGTGDMLVLIGAVFWALHVLLLSYLAPRTHPVRLAMVQFLFCGLLSLIIAMIAEVITLKTIVAAAIPILYGGICSVGIGYTLQVVAQRRAHPAHASILLSLEAVFAAIGGWWLLGEVLSVRGLFGCGLMLGGMLFSQLYPLYRRKRYLATNGLR